MRFLHASVSVFTVSIVSVLMVASCTGGPADGGSSSSSGNGDGSCTVDGTRRANGESFAASDGCNTCRCNNGSSACTLRGCGGGPPVTDGSAGGGCQYNGSQRSVGESFPSIDGCNTCSCGAGGSVACTKKACVPDAGNDGGYTCPPDGTIDCQPIVPPQNAKFCESAYRNWIEDNCPGVMFVD